MGYYLTHVKHLGNFMMSTLLMNIGHGAGDHPAVLWFSAALPLEFRAGGTPAGCGSFRGKVTIAQEESFHILIKAFHMGSS